MNCPKCGEGLPQEANFCQSCGSPAIQGIAKKEPAATAPSKVIIATRRNKWMVLLLCLFLGVLGVHRFYVGKVSTGILYLVTFGLGGIGVLVDLIMILSGNFKDNLRQPLTE